MRARTIGYVLIVIGIMMVVHTGINFITTAKVVEIGPINIDRQQNHPIQWSPIVGVILFVGGVGLIVNKKTT
jgi:hypothetical protein